MDEKAKKIYEEVKRKVVGKDEAVRKCIIGLIAGGHLLIEDIPGVGKTTLAKSLAAACGLRVKRVQFTPDTLPSDITGFTMWDAGAKKFRFHEGAVMTNILLADEINRTSPRTQSALLQAMEEGEISEDGETYKLEKPFMVIATQNPYGSAGTQPLPMSQLDRFMLRLSLGRPDKELLAELLISRTAAEQSSVKEVCTREDMLAMQSAAREVYLSEAAAGWIAGLTELTHTSSLVDRGASPRAAISLAAAAKAAAFVDGRDFVVPDDIAMLFADCTSHRISISSQAEHEGASAYEVCERLLGELPPPHIKGGSK